MTVDFCLLKATPGMLRLVHKHQAVLSWRLLLSPRFFGRATAGDQDPSRRFSVSGLSGFFNCAMKGRFGSEMRRGDVALP